MHDLTAALVLPHYLKVNILGAANLGLTTFMKTLLSMWMLSCVCAAALAKEPVEIEMRDRRLASVIAWAEIGDRAAMADLCRRYKTGSGAQGSDADAMLACTRSAETGERTSRVWLGDLYFTGSGVGRDYAKALAWYEKAASAGQAQAQFSLYRMYDQGLGVPADPVRAMRYLREAAQGGDMQAAATLKKIEPRWLRQPVEAQALAVRYVEDQDMLRFSADPGMFNSAFYRLDAAPRGTVTLALTEIRAHAQWAPMASVCLAAEAPSDIACLKFHRADRDSDDISAVLATLPPDQKSERDRIDLPGTFAVGQTVRLGIEVEAGYLKVSINGQAVSVQKLDFRPELIRLGCSTAVCDFALD